VSFPVYIRVGSLHIHPHLFFEVLAYAAGFLVFLGLRRRNGDLLCDDLRWWMISAAVVGAAIGCRLLGWIEMPSAGWHQAGKTIVGGLAGGLIAVELAKKRLGVTAATGDLFALPLIVGITIGRVGCFLTGLADDTYGKPTNLPWAVDFGDGLPRHPTQLYEILFMAALTFALLDYSKRPHKQGDLFKLFVIAYMAWRFLIDFLKPETSFLAMSPIRIVCLIVLAYYVPHTTRMVRELTSRTAVAEG